MHMPIEQPRPQMAYGQAPRPLHKSTNVPFFGGIDTFNKNVINRTISEVKREYEASGGMASSMQNYGGLGHLSGFAGLNDETGNNGIGINQYDETSISDTLKQLQFLWESKF